MLSIPSLVEASVIRRLRAVIHTLRYRETQIHLGIQLNAKAQT